MHIDHPFHRTSVHFMESCVRFCLFLFVASKSDSARDGVYYKQSITVTFQNFQSVSMTMQSITSIIFYYIYNVTMKMGLDGF